MSLLQSRSTAKQCWFVDDVTGAGSLEEVKQWWDELREAVDMPPDDCNSSEESLDTLEDSFVRKNSCDYAKLHFEQMVTSTDDEDMTTENESLLGGSSPISSAIVKLVIMFFISWKTLRNVSDSAISILFDFFKKLINLLATVSQSIIIKESAILFPHSLFRIRNCLGINRDDFEKFIVCHKCSSIYKPEECVRTLTNGRKKGERCKFVEFPNHRSRTQRKACGASLFKSVPSKNGDVILKAKRVFCYHSVKKTLPEFLKRPGFAEKCEEFRCLNSHKAHSLSRENWYELCTFG
ncbi:hypothetical protein AWC38_SpisGene24223 [Stylophora pistillata]|uniref:Uncharacterized protein n=1 Tax=Stylophora pistillata TaxID=50429 RepID=A0A2B4R6P3_STYPI|nr:hypothetical protein AWC38_SpisGene24223 [Stylophora pistillata]